MAGFVARAHEGAGVDVDDRRNTAGCRRRRLGVVHRRRGEHQLLGHVLLFDHIDVATPVGTVELSVRGRARSEGHTVRLHGTRAVRHGTRTVRTVRESGTDWAVTELLSVRRKVAIRRRTGAVRSSLVRTKGLEFGNVQGVGSTSHRNPT